MLWMGNVYCPFHSFLIIMKGEGVLYTVVSNTDPSLNPVLDLMIRIFYCPNTAPRILSYVLP